MTAGSKIVLWPETVAGESGVGYAVYSGSREIMRGWSKGRRKDAMDAIKQTIAERAA